MLQAPMFDGLSFDPVTLEDGGTTVEVDIGGRQVAEAFVVSAVIVVVDERLDLSVQGTRKVVVFQQDAVLQGLAPALDLALHLGMVGRPAEIGHALLVEPFGKLLLGVPAVESGAGHTDLFQGAPGREARLLDGPDDLDLLGWRIPLSASSPSLIMLF